MALVRRFPRNFCEETMSNDVHFISDYACPWCYLGYERLKRVASDTGRNVSTLHFPLAPDVPTEGKSLREHLGGRFDLDQAVARLEGLMDAEGLEYPTDIQNRKVFNTARLQELALYAEAQGVETQAINDRFFRAYQVENRNVHELDVLRELAVDLGLDGDAAVAAIESGQFAQLRSQHWNTARQAGVTGVPTYVADGRGVVGAQPEQVLRDLLG